MSHTLILVSCNYAPLDFKLRAIGLRATTQEGDRVTEADRRKHDQQNPAHFGGGASYDR